MKTIDLTSTTPAPTLQDILQRAGGENLILRAADGREFVLAEVDDFGREVELVRRNDELLDFLDARSGPRKTYSLDEARAILDDAD